MDNNPSATSENLSEVQNDGGRPFGSMGFCDPALASQDVIRDRSSESAAAPSIEQIIAARNTNCEAYRIEQAVLAERERCAKIAEGYGALHGRISERLGKEVAAKIRSAK